MYFYRYRNGNIEKTIKPNDIVDGTFNEESTCCARIKEAKVSDANKTAWINHRRAFICIQSQVIITISKVISLCFATTYTNQPNDYIYFYECFFFRKNKILC